MPEDLKEQGQIPTTSGQVPGAAGGNDGQQPADDWMTDPAKVREMMKNLREENAKHRTEKRELEKRMSSAEAEAAKAQEAKLQEQNQYKELYEKRDKELNDLKAQLQQAQQTALRATIAGEFGLPPALAARLQGATDEDMRKDAETLKALIPAGTPRQGQNTAPAPGGQPGQETDEQRRARLFGKGGNIFGGGTLKT
jgi:vacuolar-type H+-ATPase subunit I/STV1